MTDTITQALIQELADKFPASWEVCEYDLHLVQQGSGELKIVINTGTHSFQIFQKDPTIFVLERQTPRHRRLVQHYDLSDPNSIPNLIDYIQNNNSIMAYADDC